MTNRKQIHFFALKEDILPILNIVENGGVKYILTGQFSNAEYLSFDHGSDLPNLGQSSAENGMLSDTFLVTRPSVVINLRKIDLVSGERCYAIDQLCNPDTISLTPAGLWRKDIILRGRVATVSDTTLSRELMKLFSSAIKKHFRKIGPSFIGSKAFSLFQSGKRLTIAEQSPAEFDLSIN